MQYIYVPIGQYAIRILLYGVLIRTSNYSCTSIKDVHY